MVKMWTEILEQPVILERLGKDLGAVRELVKAIRLQKPNLVCIAARGTSDHAAVYGKYIIELITGIPVALAASSIYTLYQKNLNFHNCLVIGISQSGKAADVLEVIRSANRQGAITVSITNFPDSPLAQEARFHLDCQAGTEESVAATKTFTAELFLLGQLVAEWSGDQKIAAELLQIPAQLGEIIEVSKTIETKVARYRFMNECFVLARGTNYAVSLEAALKIQETTYVRAEAFSTSDFQHGPIAMIDQEIPVMVFAPEGPSFQDVSGMVNRLSQSRIELMIVSNNQEMLDKGTCAISIPKTENDLISPFLNVTVAQMFACQLALLKGLNPDTPRELKKVTITR
jgi:glutamine---fructose-6-phosphate transaminase (isomerizing)